MKMLKKSKYMQENLKFNKKHNKEANTCRKKVAERNDRRASEGTGRTGRDKVFAPMKRKEKSILKVIRKMLFDKVIEKNLY